MFVGNLILKIMTNQKEYLVKRTYTQPKEISFFAPSTADVINEAEARQLVDIIPSELWSYYEYANATGTLKITRIK